MRRFTALVVLVLLACASAPALAGDRQARRAERMAVELEKILAPLFGSLESGRAQFRAHGNGLYSVGYPLGEVDRDRFRAARAGEKSLQLLTNGHMLTEPLEVATLINAVVADNTALYNFWWATVNLGDEELARKTIVQISGPDGFELEVSEDEVPYGPATLWVYWFTPEEPLGGEGIYTHRTIVRTAGKTFYSFIAETPPPPEEDEEGEEGDAGEGDEGAGG